VNGDTSKRTTLVLLIIILLAAFVLRQYRLLDFPYHGDEVNEGDIALDMLSGHLAHTRQANACSIACIC